MSIDVCATLADALAPIASGVPATAEQQAHLDGCESCRARLALAVRLERMLVEWPVPAPTPAFTLRVADAARREIWRREQVVDWSFNVAIAAGLAAVLVGLGALAWLLGSAAGPGASATLLANAVGDLLVRVRSQAMVMATGTLLLTTALGAWLWAEGRMRW
jgi:predicted anti-sigma-YlaC factor YlaD